MDAVCTVENDRDPTRGAHSLEGAHVYHQVPVAEKRTAFGHRDAKRSGLPNLLDSTDHIFGCRPLALLDIDHLPGFACRTEQVGLTAKKSWNLKDVGHLGPNCRLIDLMDVGQNREAGLVLYTAQLLESERQAGATR